MKNLLLILVFLAMISCSNSMTDKEKQEYTDIGNEISQASFKALSEKLTAQMKMGGTAQAIPFCNIEAMPLTQEMSEKYRVNIKRTSNKLRNQKNKPTERELEIINNYHKLISEKKGINPIVEINNNNNRHFYAPIVVKANCLVCHGKVGEFVTVKTDSIIKSLYPNDKAIGYNEGDLRGIWSIEFKK
ncbi:MAG: hypothetical protein CVU08_06270 [Bacteroidetes bacterium HGW-Bacteroidetes-3]|jgi:hypothetical protein|nr:MAG: hypothetical protein CVU08_06270 [Bacteroidetes bacterium HGW-Bacteroidetes-3]